MRVKKILLIFCILIFLYALGCTAHASGLTAGQTGGLIISEVVSSDSNSIVDPVFGKPDWIELYNASAGSINLKDYSIGKSRRKMYYFGDTVIDPGKYLVLYCCNAPDGISTDKICTGFKLSKSGVLLFLSSPNGIIQELHVPKLKRDVSFGIDSDGRYAYFKTPTPGAANGKPLSDPGSLEGDKLTPPNYEMTRSASLPDTFGGIDIKFKVQTSVRLSSLPIGRKDNSIKISGTCNSIGALGNITAFAGQALIQFEHGELFPCLSSGIASNNRDAVFQTKNSVATGSSNAVQGCCEKPLFSIPGGHQTSSPVLLTITAATEGAEIHYTLDGSAPTADSPEYTGTIKISKPSKAAGVTIRAVAIKSGMHQSVQAAATYLFDAPHSLPVICLSIKKSDLNYVSGSKNRSDKRERAGYVEYYDTDGKPGVSFPAGFRISGAGTRQYKQRTISLYLRRDYGQSSVTYPFFEGYDITTFKSLQLRHMGAWQDPTLLRDAYFSDIVNGMKINNAQTKFAAVYVNGKYWGMYEFKENENEKFLASRHDIDSDKVVMVRANNHNVNTGKTNNDIQNLYSLASKNMNDSGNFTQYTRLADSNYFMDYLIAETFFECSDTYNQKFAHTTDTALKWQPIYYDLDLSLTDLKTNDFTKIFF